MPGDAAFQQVARNFVPVKANYDGLKGKIIAWSFEHGNDNHDPSVLAWVLDPKGELIAKAPGSVVYQAASFSKWLAKHAKASFPLVNVADFTILRKQAVNVANRKKLGATMKALRGFATQTADPAKQAEAKTLMAKLQTYADYTLDRAKQKQTSDPADALEIYRALAKEFKGDAIGDAAKKTHDALRKDPAFKRELKAHRFLAQAITIAASKKKRGKPDPVVLRKAGLLLMQMRKKFPDTAAAKRATKLLGEWGIR